MQLPPIRPVTLKTPVPPEPEKPHIGHASWNALVLSDNPQVVQTALLAIAWSRKILLTRITAYTIERRHKTIPEINPVIRNAESASYSRTFNSWHKAVSAYHKEAEDRSWHSEVESSGDVWKCPIEVDAASADYLNRLWGTIWLLLIWNIATNHHPKQVPFRKINFIHPRRNAA